MMDALEGLMVNTFWQGLGVVIAIDIVLAVAKRRTFSQRARSLGKDLPVIAYGLGLLPCHFWYNYPLVEGLTGGVIMVGVGVCIVCYEIITAAPMRPIVAFAIGLPVGALFFVN